MAAFGHLAFAVRPGVAIDPCTHEDLPQKRCVPVHRLEVRSQPVRLGRSTRETGFGTPVSFGSTCLTLKEKLYELCGRLVFNLPCGNSDDPLIMPATMRASGAANRTPDPDS